MQIESLIATYGLPVLFAGAFFEEISIVAIAGFLAHQGYFSLGTAIAVSALAAFVGGETMFFLGLGQKAITWLARRADWIENLERARRFVEKHQIIMILGFRYVYGMHTIGPISLGMSHVRVRRFTIVNAIGALIWATTFSCAGYEFGRVLQIVLADVKRIEPWAAAFLAVLGALFWVAYRVRRKRRKLRKT